ncbi:MAG: hypothetical protein C0609_12565 [Deltaproteobacteria bacterium]|nr:MAG: hypothetical protein C0609_12565 [Deltaproteobacteria bacterium]
MAERVLKTSDVIGVEARIPEGHKHLRTTITLADGEKISLQEATVAAIVRAYIHVKTHPTATSLTLRGGTPESAKEGFAAWQLIEDDG